MIASKADIIAYESLGFSHVVWRGESYFVNLDLESSRLKFKEYLEKETGKKWDIAELERYVFYRKDMYILVGNILMLNDTFQGKVEIPINTVSCDCMFMNKNLEGMDFSDFDTSGIENMRYMFKDCTFPEGFSLGDKFDTSKVEDMWGMFLNCTFPADFSLSDKFDTSSVENMRSMFYRCTFPEGFSLGDMFDTSSVTNMHNMFSKCDFPEGFSLGDNFNTSKVENMYDMFSGCTFSEGFSLGNKFDTSKVDDMSYMFNHTKFNEDFRLARNFTISSRSEGMFLDAKLPSRITKQLGSGATDEKIAELLKLDSGVTEVSFSY